jgi:NHS family xanthosine MFS transporter
MSFLQFFVWGAWLIIWELLVLAQGWSGAEFGAVFSTLGIASIMPALTGMPTDGLMPKNYTEYYIS